MYLLHREENGWERGGRVGNHQRYTEITHDRPPSLWCCARNIFWLSTERLSCSTLHLKEGEEGSLYSCNCDVLHRRHGADSDKIPEDGTSTYILHLSGNHCRCLSWRGGGHVFHAFLQLTPILKCFLASFALDSSPRFYLGKDSSHLSRHGAKSKLDEGFTSHLFAYLIKHCLSTFYSIWISRGTGLVTLKHHMIWISGSLFCVMSFIIAITSWTLNQKSKSKVHFYNMLFFTITLQMKGRWESSKV